MRIALAVVVALCFEAPWCFASAELIPVPVVEERVIRGGDRVLIRWGAFAAAVEEFELLLSTDGGRSYLIRVSPELEGRSVQYVWRAPNVSAAEARVRIRARIHGRETNGPPSGIFSLVRDPARPPERWLFREAGGWGEQEEYSRAPFNLERPGPGCALVADHSLPYPETPLRMAVPVPRSQGLPRHAAGCTPTDDAPITRRIVVSRFRPMRE